LSPAAPLADLGELAFPAPTERNRKSPPSPTRPLALRVTAPSPRSLPADPGTRFSRRRSDRPTRGRRIESGIASARCSTSPVPLSCSCSARLSCARPRENSRRCKTRARVEISHGQDLLSICLRSTRQPLKSDLCHRHVCENSENLNMG